MAIAGSSAQVVGSGVVTASDFDPDAVPVRPAATVLILDERPDLQVLMLKRNARSIFVGDMWVFPGGAVDPGDATARADAAVEHLTDTAASRTLGVPGGGIAYWVAALRETFEEAGVLLARPRGDAALIDLSRPDVQTRFEHHRDTVNDGTGDFIDVVIAEDLLLDGADVHYVAHWITPSGSPRRYDTRFFVTAMPPGQVPLHDDDEAVHHEWVRPTDALAANVSGEMVMLTPTIAMLARLAAFGDAATAVAAAAAAPDDGSLDEVVRIRRDVDGPGRVAVPADPDYLDADEHVESGILRWPVPT